MIGSDQPDGNPIDGVEIACKAHTLIVGGHPNCAIKPEWLGIEET
ncbi:MAG: hypothetical protein OXB95_02905 [Rhodobacteraceae bacterium]|nr:hypothetical protein [Paracoccaceae bacterium]